MPNGRCKNHGGKSTGPKNPVANTRSKNFGIYSSSLTEDEKNIEFELGNVDAELEIARLHLKRSLDAKAKYDDAAKHSSDDMDESALQLVEVTRDEGTRIADGAEIPISSYRKVRRRPPFEEYIHRWMSRIESLEKTRKELVGDGGDETIREKAAKLKEFLDEMDDTVPDVGE